VAVKALEAEALRQAVLPRLTLLVHDATKPLPSEIAPASLDAALLVFVLSAIAPHRHATVASMSLLPSNQADASISATMQQVTRPSSG